MYAAPSSSLRMCTFRS